MEVSTLPFESTLNLNSTTISIQQAIEVLRNFHKVAVENILCAFMYLRNPNNTNTIRFKRGVNNGYPCIVMEGYDNSNKLIWSHLIDRHTGQPQVKIG